MNPEAHFSGNGPPQRGVPDNSTRLANGLFALAGAGAFLFVLLLAVRNAAPPGLAYFPLSSALVIVQVALLTVTFFGLGIALRRANACRGQGVRANVLILEVPRGPTNCPADQ